MRLYKIELEVRKSVIGYDREVHHSVITYNISETVDFTRFLRCQQDGFLVDFRS